MVEKAKSSHAARIRELMEKSGLKREKDPGHAKTIENLPAVKEKLLATVKGSVGKYLNTQQTKTGNETIDLENVVLDEAAPLTLEIKKRFRYTDKDEFKNATFEFFIKKPGTTENIAFFLMRDYGDEFRLSHREVHPDYRRSGLGDMCLEAMEEFVREYVEKVPKREPVIEANAGQLDVWSWMDKNGFETTMDPVPIHPGENVMVIRNLDEVLTSLETEDGKYRVAPFNYVFPAEFQGPRIVKGGIHVDDQDHAARIHFRKRLTIEHQGVQDVSDSVRTDLGFPST